MKQGRASRDVRESTKVEPKNNMINPRGVSQIGSAMGNHVTDRSASMKTANVIERINKGRGFQAPRDYGREVFQGGSQKRS